ncbi:hypothetical protein DPMN_062835 [Dreissena polymorpha]|uniref:Uncharacterized protein n=1 Tax=Dreissena polymorpha TaxID=45954 RepID=A0A9D4C9W6_DREPO|nr:hypothetical protein DPMN_062835 [Dreissena polymorpha]
MIRQAGHEKLPNSDYWVKDQYPKELEDKRRSLYQIADELRKNKDNKVVLVTLCKRTSIYTTAIRQRYKSRHKHQDKHEQPKKKQREPNKQQ